MAITDRKKLYVLFDAQATSLLQDLGKSFPVNASVTPNNAGEWRSERLRRLTSLSGKWTRETKKLVRESLRTLDQLLVIEAYGQGHDLDVLYSPHYELHEDNDDIRPIVDEHYAELAIALTLVGKRMVESAKDNYKYVAMQTALLVGAETRTYNDAVSRALRDVATTGIIGSSTEYRDEKVDSFVRNTVETSLSGIQGKVLLTRAAAWGSNLVEVSAHIGARPSHALWQGAVYQIEGKSKEYQNLYTATEYGQMLGLKGLNCYHEMWPYIPGVTERSAFPIDLEENQRVYEQIQQQRDQERSLRTIEARRIVAESSGDTERAHEEKLKWQIRNEKLQEFCKKHNLEFRQDRVK